MVLVPVHVRLGVDSETGKLTATPPSRSGGKSRSTARAHIRLRRKYGTAYRV